MTPDSAPLKVAGSLLVILVAACSGPESPTLQPVPEPNLDDMSNAIRDQIGAAISTWRDDEADPDANGSLGMLFDTYSRVSEAEVFYSRARFLDPDSFKWTYLHGLTLAKLGENDAAIDALERALAKRRGHPGAQLALAGRVNSQGDPGRSQQLYTQLIERNPVFARAHFEYGKLLFEQGDTDAAITSLKTALRLSNRYGQAHYTLSQAYREIGDRDKATLHLALFERFRRFAPGHNDSLRDEIAALNVSESNRQERALILSSQGKREEAAAELEEITLSTDSAAPHINLVAIYGDLGDHEKAEAHAGIAMSIDPESRELNDNLGVLRLHQRRYDDAERFFRTAIDIDPEYSVPYKNLGVVYEATRRLDDAISNYRRSIALDPYDRQARHFLARALLADDQPDEAIAVIEVITEYSQPETPEYFQLIGRAYERKREYQEASDAYKRAVIEAQARGRMVLAAEATKQMARTRGLMRQP